jgi:hypothetical protein
MTTKILIVLLAFGVCGVALTGCRGGNPGPQPGQAPMTCPNNAQPDQAGKCPAKP